MCQVFYGHIVLLKSHNHTVKPSSSFSAVNRINYSLLHDTIYHGIFPTVIIICFISVSATRLNFSPIEFGSYSGVHSQYAVHGGNSRNIF